MLIDAIKRTNPEFEFTEPDGDRYFIDLLFGSDAIRKKDFDPTEYLNSQKPKIENFKKISEKYYLC